MICHILLKCNVYERKHVTMTEIEECDCCRSCHVKMYVIIKSLM